jgi:hypothetical protein
MALNKAQLMEVPGGPGVTGAVKAGTGILISGDGTISVNPATNVTQLIAGSNITLTPANGFGAVTITASGGQAGGVTKLLAGQGISLNPSSGLGDVTITSAQSGGTITGVTAGTGLSGGGTTGSVTLNNTGVTGLTAGTNITLSGSTGNVTISASGGGGGISPADFNTAVAGTSTTVYSNPAVAVAKTNGAAGAAILPKGTNGERPTPASTGMLRFNDDPASPLGERVEVNTTIQWRKLEYAVVPPTAPDVTIPGGTTQSGVIVCNNFTANSGFTIAGSLTVFASGNVTLQGLIDGNGNGPRGAEAYVTQAQYAVIYVGSGFNIGGGSSTIGGRAYSAAVSLVGSGGAGGFVSPDSGQGPGGTGAGGDAGASLIIRTLGSINSFANIQLNGSAGFINDRGSNIAVSGPGGGSGGVCIFHANGNSQNNNIIQASGGVGGGPHNNGGGGGGGGGGIVIVQSDFGTPTLGNCVVNGGAGAPGGGGNALGGGGGGACGGAGGDAGSTAGAAGVAGLAGIATTTGSPL